MNPLNSLLSLDSSLFLAINQLPHPYVINVIAILLSAGSGYIWYFLFALALLLIDRKKGIYALGGITLSSAFTYLIVNIILKPFFNRPRPDIAHEGTVVVRSVVDSIVPINIIGTDFAFPSGHSTMAFAGAYILSNYAPKQKWFWYIFATLVALSRVYLGKHFPIDILAGAFVGIGIGWLSHRILTTYAGKYN